MLSEADAGRRPIDEVVGRAIALYHVSSVARGERPRTGGRYADRIAWTRSERAFLRANSPDDSLRTGYAWQHEACWTLLWALDCVDRLDPPDQLCSVERLEAAMETLYERLDAGTVKLRPLPEILDVADATYCRQAAILAARHAQQGVAGSMDPAVVGERFHALRWLVAVPSPDWRKVSD